MAKWWMSMMLVAGGFAWSAAAFAQPPALMGQNPAPVTTGVLGPVFDVPESGAAEPIYHFGFEYLMWWFSETRGPGLVTQGPSTDAVPAALGQPGTQVLANKSSGDPLQGGRITFGLGVDSQANWSLQASAFWLGEGSNHQHFSSTGASGSNVLARPFFNVVSGVEDADPAAFPSVASGSLDVASVRQMQGYDVDLRYLYLANSDGRLVFLMGASYLQLQETLTMQENSQDLPGFGPPGNSYYLSEKFGTRNSFYGGELGTDYEYHLGPVFIKSVTKVGFGAVNQTVSRNAFTQITEANGIVTTSNDRALFITPANAGTVSRTRFAVAPAEALRIGIDFNENVRMSVGYSFLYISDVVRPNDQIDRNVIVQPIGTSATFGTPARTAQFHSNDFWAQGLDVALRFSF